MEVVMFSIYLSLWIIYILVYFYLYPRNPSLNRSISWISYSLFFLINILFFAGFLLLIFYSPIKKKYDDEIESAKEDYLKYKEDVETIYADQLKGNWVTATNTENKYYVIGFMIMLLFPFLYYLVYLVNNQLPYIAHLIENMRYTMLTISCGIVFASTVWWMILFGFNIWILLLGIPPAIFIFSRIAFLILNSRTN